MVEPRARLSRLAFVIPCITLAVALSVTSATATSDTIRVWKIGSPHVGDIPDAKVPSNLAHDASSLGLRFSIDAFPAKDFASIFRDAVTRNEAPDLLVFDNMGVMNGISTKLGTFEGIGEDPILREEFIRVTGAFDELLGPARGWTYLIRLSANHQAAKALAMKAPSCPREALGPMALGELTQIVPTIATAYLQGDTAALQPYSDPERLQPGVSSLGAVDVGVVQTCGVWGNDTLAFVSVNVSSESNATIGSAPVLLVLRRPSSHWQLLAAARDPISNGRFVKDLPMVTATLANDQQQRAPLPAMLVSPASGDFPRPLSGQRFGDFTWSSSPSDDTVAEIVEFAYKDDARLVARRVGPPGARRQVSAGDLWTTRGTWNWRVWSISRGGGIAFSEARTFFH